MKKTLFFSSFLFVFCCFFVGYSNATDEEGIKKSNSIYQLDEDKAEAYQIKEVEKENLVEASTPDGQEKTNDVKIVKEKTDKGYIEKLIDNKGLVIAEKTIEGDQIVKKVLNEYYPNAKLQRQITSEDSDGSFYAEEYYTNGKIASQSAYLNAANKIGKEKKYDTAGVLRQEIPWELPKTEEDKPFAERQTIRFGEIKTYYPNGKLAAIFSIGQKGKNIFYDKWGKTIKTIENRELLNFPNELTKEDCLGKVIQLNIDELIELYEDEGDISYNKCGMPYRENFAYEVLDTYSDGTTSISYDSTGMIRRMTPFVSGKKHGLERKYDALGNLTAEINYKNGVKDGYATGYFPTKEVAFRKRYEDGKVNGNLMCYFPTGGVAAQITYKDGLKEGKAVVNSPVQKELHFSKGELLDKKEKDSKRKIISAISGLDKIEEKCLNVKERIDNFAKTITTNENNIMKSFEIKLPLGCEDLSKFQKERGRLKCYNANKKLLATIPQTYGRSTYVVENIFTPTGTLLYDIPRVKDKKQGWTKRYDENKNVEAEIFFNEDILSGTSRTFYADGIVQNILTFSDDRKRRLLAGYQDDGKLKFSLTYKDDLKNEAYLNTDNKDIVVRYYEGKIDSIRESNQENPYDFVEYNLPLSEYAVYGNNQLITGGKLCQYAQASDIEIINLKPTQEPQKNIQDVSNEKTKDYLASDKLEPALLPTATDKRQTELAAKNIGPVTKPNIENMSDVVQKTTVLNNTQKTEEDAEPKTEKLYYPSGTLRKTIRTKGPRTEEIKEYSKTGLLSMDTVYGNDKITIEKYYGSGEIRRRTEKNYDDNAITAFLQREDFYVNGQPRYEIKRQIDKLLFNDKNYNIDGTVKSETTQNGVFSFTIKEYNQIGKLANETIKEGSTELVKEYDDDGKITKLTLNGKDISLNLAGDGADLLKDNSKIYNTKGILVSTYIKDQSKDSLVDYYPNNKIKTEIIFYHNGEISVKSYATDGSLQKFAFLAPDGKLHIEKPILRVVPSYRERYWVDYNNPRWIENQDKYSVQSIARLNLDTLAYILAELEIDVPEIMKKIYEMY